MTLATEVRLKVPYLSQLDNANRPSGTCNVTSVAMCLRYYGIVGNGNGQLEDQIFDWMESRGLDRHVHDDLVSVFERYGLGDRFTTSATWDEVKQHLSAGNPVIYSGQLTRSGHIIVLTGYDKQGFFVNDPYGEWFSWGYDTTASGEGLHYSYKLLRDCSLGDGGENTTWAHFPFKPKK